MRKKHYPKVGVGVIVMKDDKVLIGKRREKYGQGTWAFPGGGLEYGESFEDCAKRETVEEAGIEIDSVIFGAVINDVMKESGKHYVTVYMKANYPSGDPHPADGEFEEWRWADWDNLPLPRFIPLENLLRSGYRPF